MRFTTETTVRGETHVFEISDADFCPECCGTLAVEGSGERQHLKCTSCYLVFRPKKEERAS